jgi:hypothetical protein
LPGKGELRGECDKDGAGKPDRHVRHVEVCEFQPQAEIIRTSSAFCRSTAWQSSLIVAKSFAHEA